jgi:hypothetical protein
VGLLGFSDSIGVAIRRTMVQMLAPDEMRGRASSFLTVFAQTANAVGAVRRSGCRAGGRFERGSFRLSSMLRHCACGLLDDSAALGVSIGLTGDPILHGRGGFQTRPYKSCRANFFPAPPRFRPLLFAETYRTAAWCGHGIVPRLFDLGPARGFSDRMRHK